MSCVHLLAVHPYQRKVATAACGERLTLRHSMWRTVRVAEEEIALIGVAARPWCARCLEVCAASDRKFSRVVSKR
jgi:hypothetical protein